MQTRISYQGSPSTITALFELVMLLTCLVSCEGGGFLRTAESQRPPKMDFGGGEDKLFLVRVA